MSTMGSQTVGAPEMDGALLGRCTPDPKCWGGVASTIPAFAKMIVLWRIDCGREMQKKARLENHRHVTLDYILKTR